MASSKKTSPGEPPSPHEEAASQVVARRHLMGWTKEEEAAIEIRMASDPLFADAVRRVERSSRAVGAYAGSPELIRFREQALARARRVNARRWLGPAVHSKPLRLAASLVGLAVVVAAIQLSPWAYRPGQYKTGVGEQRVLELEDRSRIVLDSSTRLQVHFTDDVRVVQLAQGQAQFSVGKDSRRPFKVQAGEHTIVALGTDFTVEYVDHEMHVAMLEGRVAVVSEPTHVAAAPHRSSRPPSSVSKALSGARGTPSKEGETTAPTGEEGASVVLVAGEALRVSREGSATLISKADLEAATAWRRGKVIFRNEPLGEAVRRVNRYSRVQLEVDDPGLARIPFSGVFDTGDARTFAEAVQTFLPVSLETPDSDTIRLRAR